MQAWERTGYSLAWAKEVGLDGRGMRFARDVRRQLEGVAAADGAGPWGRGGHGSASRPAAGTPSSRRAMGLMRSQRIPPLVHGKGMGANRSQGKFAAL